MSSSALQFPGIDAAIAAFETGGSPTSAASLANNPGALTAPGGLLTQGEISAGATGTAAVANGQYLATFPTAAQGSAAEDAQVGYYAGQGDTISQLISNWSIGPNGTPTETTANYIQSVASAVGVPASTAVSALAGVGTAATGAAATAGTCGLMTPGACFTGFSWGRVAAFVLGTVAIIGAVFMLKDKV